MNRSMQNRRMNLTKYCRCRGTRQITAKCGAGEKTVTFFFGNGCQLVIHRKALVHSLKFEVRFGAKQAFNLQRLHGHVDLVLAVAMRPTPHRLYLGVTGCLDARFATSN